MVLLDELKQKLTSNEQKLIELEGAIGISALKEKVAELEEQTTAPDFWGDQEKAQKILSQAKRLKDTVERYEKLTLLYEDTLMMIDMSEEEDDDSFISEIEASVEKFNAELEAQTLETLLSGEYDKNNAILTLHAGAGGTEAQDWAEMLYRMYTRFAEKNGYKYKILDYLEGDVAGIKSATVLIEGHNAYGYLKAEGGVHRLVRVSPFDSSGRRHTSFASVEVMPELEEDDDIVIKDEDIEVTAHRSSGAGGQHVNKTDSAIRILHIPTGIVVGCQTERSQHQNKEYAMKMLKAKLAEIKERENLERIEDIKGEQKEIAWGSQIRSYVFMPYTLVKDLRTEYEVGNIGAVMDGDLNGFINAYLKYIKQNGKK